MPATIVPRRFAVMAAQKKPRAMPGL